MQSRRTPHYSDDELIRALEEVAKKLKHNAGLPKNQWTITREEYDRNKTQYSSMVIRKRFGGWTKAILRAGLKQVRVGDRTTENMVEEIKRIAEILTDNHGINVADQTITKQEYEQKNPKYSVSAVVKHFGTWNKAVKSAGLAVAKEMNMTNEEVLLRCKAVYDKNNGTLSVDLIDTEADISYATVKRKFNGVKNVLNLIHELEGGKSDIIEEPVRPEFECGPWLYYKSMSYGPRNENGVIFLFGIMAESLGFLVESVVPNRYPDMHGKRYNEKTKSYTQKRIELEVNSRDFVTHGHDPRGCDVIVCWEHNWPECPSTIEVISLKAEIEMERHKNR